jgi:hypothetical protein
VPPALPCKQSAVVISQNVLARNGVAITCAAMQARCCCDPMLWRKKGVLYLRCHYVSSLPL